MNFDLAEEQKMLADQVRGLLAEQSSPDRLRHLVDTGAEWDESEAGVRGGGGNPGPRRGAFWMVAGHIASPFRERRSDRDEGACG